MGKSVTRVAQNGISRDYKIALGAVEHYLKQAERCKAQDLGPRYLFMAARTLSQRPLPRYEEFFDPSEYDGAITENNRSTVDRLNTVIDKLNELCMSEEAANLLRDRAGERYLQVARFYEEAIAIIEGKT